MRTLASHVLLVAFVLAACDRADRSRSEEAPRPAEPAKLVRRDQAPPAPAPTAQTTPVPEPRSLVVAAIPAPTVKPGPGKHMLATGRFGNGGGGYAARGDAMSAEAYHDWGKNAWTDAAVDHLSTFAADVDTASYTIVRRKLTEGTLPPPAAVRVEELVNYFHYDLPAPAPGGDAPFGVAIDAAPSPFAPDRYVVRVALATAPIPDHDRKPAHLVFLVDVSGSMLSPDKLPLAKQSLRILTSNLKAGDTVALVTYAGATRVVLPPTGMDHKDQILAAIEDLTAGGSTAMASGIDLAYAEAMKGLVPGAISRVILCTDGDANVGAHSYEDLLKIIAGRAKEGVTLSTVGFGMGNYKDETMERLADKGNGNNVYIDSLMAAKRVFQEQLGSTLDVVAKDVKLQVDFDPAQVARYRLIGYENRDVADADFRNDKVDAGQVGAGHQVTALYEVELTAQAKQTPAPLGGLRVRHKAPRGTRSTETAFPMAGPPAASFANTAADFRFAFAVAAFADILRGNPDTATWSLAQLRDLARAAAGTNPDRLELVGLIDRAVALRANRR
ncbi:MAG TPA: VWA domain-containing protein [Kofleriaceae bacterium]